MGYKELNPHPFDYKTNKRIIDGTRVEHGNYPPSTQGGAFASFHFRTHIFNFCMIKCMQTEHT